MKINDFNSELELMKESDVRSEEREVSVTKKPMHEKIEILERRGSHSKTFQKKKGKFETIFYNVPVHHYDETEKVFVEMNEDGDDVELVLTVAEDDTGMVIGRHGKIAKAIRQIMKVAATKTGKRVTVEIK